MAWDPSEQRICIFESFAKPLLQQTPDHPPVHKNAESISSLPCIYEMFRTWSMWAHLYRAQERRELVVGSSSPPCIYEMFRTWSMWAHLYRAQERREHVVGSSSPTEMSSAGLPTQRCSPRKKRTMSRKTTNTKKWQVTSCRAWCGMS